jgi:serine/threonine protein phosphatase PrpC
MLSHTSTELVRSYISNSLMALSNQQSQPAQALLRHGLELLPQTLSESPAPSFSYGVGLHPGIRRAERPNEDYVFATVISPPQGTGESPESVGLFVVADGLGGHEGGAEAAQLAVHRLVDTLLAGLVTEELAPGSLLLHSMRQANEAVYQRNQEVGRDMGTTMTAVLTCGAVYWVAHVGDSRAYYYQPERGLRQLTRDHTWVARMVERGEITPEQAAIHPCRSHLYQSLGHCQEVEIPFHCGRVAGGETLLLCSDGLWSTVSEQEMAGVLASATLSPQEIAERLVKLALLGGGRDNVGVVVARYQETDTITDQRTVPLDPF